MNKIQKEGYQAYHDGIPFRKNPYKQVDDRLDWDNGWIYANLEELDEQAGDMATEESTGKGR